MSQTGDKPTYLSITHPLTHPMTSPLTSSEIPLLSLLPLRHRGP